MKRDCLRLAGVAGALLLSGMTAWAQPQADGVAACEAPTPADQRLVAGDVQAWWRAKPAQRGVGQAFSLALKLCPSDAVLLRVDASMPEHRHGMNYRPTVQGLGAGLWRADGLVWHMPGRWELLVEVEHGGQKLRMTQSVLLR